MFKFAEPLWLILLLMLPFLFYRFRKSPTSSTLDMPHIGTKILPMLEKKKKRFLLKRSFLLLIFLSSFIFALARPQKVNGTRQIYSEGIDIMLVSDISGSMKALDFKPDNRLEAAKKEMIRFINKRMNDRIGIIAFAGVSFMATPMTTDYKVLKHSIKQLSSDMVEDGTAIGMALAMALKKLDLLESQSKVVILLTDGMNNIGEVDPLTVASMASTLGIKIYCIGIGSDKEVPYPVKSHFFQKERQVMVKLEIDEKTLQEIAKRSGGKYFACDNPQRLKEIYQTIDQMEKVDVKEHVYEEYQEYFQWFLILALFTLCVSGIFYIKRRSPLQ